MKYKKDKDGNLVLDKNGDPIPMTDANGKPIAFEGSIEDLKKMSKTMNTAAERVEEVSNKIASIQAAAAQQGETLTQQQADLLAFKDLMSMKFGQSGMKDVANEMSKTVSNLFNARHPLGKRSKVDEDFKKTINYETPTDATAGYLIRDELASQIFELSDVYGNVINRVTKFTVSPGQTIKINRELAHITASWRTIAANTDSAEGEAIPDATGGTFGQISMEPILVGCKFVATNEMLEFPEIGFGAMMARKASRAIIRTRESGILKGTHGGSANDPPSDGITQDSNITDLTDLTAATAQEFLAFIANAVAAYGPLQDTVDNVLLIPSTKYYELAGETVNASNAAFIWSNPRQGIPSMLFGYELIHHNDMYDGADYHVAIGSLDSVVEITSGQLNIGFNPYGYDSNGAGWETNETLIRVYTHANYRTINPGVWRRAQFA